MIRRTPLRRLAVAGLGLLAGSCLLQAPLGGCLTFGPSPFNNGGDEPTCFDFWSILHFWSGYQIGSALGPDHFAESAGLLALYEGVEVHIWPGFAEYPLNQNCDVAVGSAGIAAAYAHER